MIDFLIKVKNSVTLTLIILIVICWALCGKIPNTIMYIVLMSLIVIFIVFHLFVAIIEMLLYKKIASYMVLLDKYDK